MSKPYIPHDKWSKRAEGEGFRARSVYKLQELDERYRLLRPGMRVLDLGAAPGSWLQYASRKIGPTGKALGLDLVEIKPVAPNVLTVQCDITDQQKVADMLVENGFHTVDLVLSDAAPSTSGIKDIDQWRSVELSMAAAELARRYLRASGTLVMKVFRGRDFDVFLKDLRKDFPVFKIASVKASRDRSREVYVVAKSEKCPPGPT